MPYFHLKQSTRHLTSTAGLMLVGHCLLVTQLERLDLRLPKRGKIKMSDLEIRYGVGHDFNSGVPKWRVYYRDESVESIEWLSGLGRKLTFVCRKRWHVESR